MRPTDPVINETQRKISRPAAGIEFLYQKEWSVTEELYKDPAIEYYIGFKLQDNKVMEIMKNPIEGRITNVVRFEETNMINGRNWKISVTSWCDKPEEKENCPYASVIATPGDLTQWLVYGRSIKNTDDMTLAINEMKEFLSLVKFQ